ncbi:MAG: glycoside hydrolase family 88 protein [Planctomycetales bacterium]|nr:glycoside hydrolase family 88 protein [Planctomycetales bacterium]
MIKIDEQLTATRLENELERLWSIAARKLVLLDQHSDAIGGTPVFTVNGKYVAQGWTEWTQGFQFGAPLLVFDAIDDVELLEIGRIKTHQVMAAHVTHVGVHDHGFNQVSTYGNLRRLALAGRFDASPGDLNFYELALKASGAVQANRWSPTADGGGYIYSFNGPHSLFSDTIRSLRTLVMAHRLGHVLWAENDRRISLLERAIQHAQATQRYNVYFGAGRDAYDVRGRVVHESIFNTNDGNYRCPSTQQGYSPFSTWTRGLAWILLGYAEQLEFLATVADDELEPFGSRSQIEGEMRKTLEAVCDFYIEHTPTCGVPYWDTGAPGLEKLGDYLDRPADPFNDHEPVDSSAAAIAAQGLLRAGKYYSRGDATDEGRATKYWQAGLTVMQSLLKTPYLSDDEVHQGLLLHTIYHRPRNWDHIPSGAKIPHGESCMWGDYHLLEAALYLYRHVTGRADYTFFGEA